MLSTKFDISLKTHDSALALREVEVSILMNRAAPFGVGLI